MASTEDDLLPEYDMFKEEYSGLLQRVKENSNYNGSFSEVFKDLIYTEEAVNALEDISENDGWNKQYDPFVLDELSNLELVNYPEDLSNLSDEVKLTSTGEEFLEAINKLLDTPKEGKNEQENAESDLDSFFRPTSDYQRKDAEWFLEEDDYKKTEDEPDWIVERDQSN